MNNHGSLPPLPPRLALELLGLGFELLDPAGEAGLGRLRPFGLPGHRAAVVVAVVAALLFHALGGVDDDFALLLFLFLLLDVIADALGFDDPDRRARADVEVQAARAVVEEDREQQ